MRRRGTAPWLVLALLAVLACLPAAAPARSGLTACPHLAGPAVHQGGRTLSHYVVGGHGGVTCSAASAWVSWILHERTPSSALAHPHGPSGFTCIARATGGVAFNGSCRDGTASFSWGAV